MLRYQFFPRSTAVTHEISEIIQCFQRNFEQINSDNNNYSSNKVLEILRADLSATNFTVETGKKDENKIKVPVLFGLNNKIDKSFNADALSLDGKIVIEVEAGRAVDNNQFLKDIFQASMMFGVEYLVIAVRNDYRGGDDFQKIYAFLETMYISSRITLPLDGILLIGY
ncbi:MAG TPA: hypothetical protein PLP21_16590 [Pyrinomonadaceae bacterium]|nr:hypothetical protein [Acidobacteriota bacterium]HQZ97940.1 hypothetical protein [Pyrinomonadaceae bacterium]